MSEKENAIQHPLYAESKTRHDELMCEAETGSHTENKLRVTEWKGGQIRSLGLRICNTIYTIDKQQGPTLQHRETHSISGNKL